MVKYGYPEPPWTYSPKEVDEWINAVYGKHKCRKAKVEKHEKWLKNVEIDIDLDVEKEIKSPSNFILRVIEKIVGYITVEEHFELIPTAEILLRALSKAGYKKVKIKIDGKEIGMEKMRRAMEEIVKFIDESDGKEVEIYAIDDGEASIKIRKIHPKSRHSVEIKINKIKERRLQKFLIYIRKRLHGEIK